jgi:hypothetical protein
MVYGNTKVRNALVFSCGADGNADVTDTLLGKEKRRDDEEEQEIFHLITTIRLV